MTVSFVGAQAAAAATVTIPAHQVGDLIFIFAYRDGSNTTPTTPTAGGTVPAWNIIGSTGGNTNSSTFAQFTATATTTTSGTWTNATELVCLVYRGATVGASAGGSGTNTTIVNYPALTLQRTDNSSWVVGVAGHRTATNMEVAPGAMVNRAFAGTEAAGHDTNGTVTTWASTNVTVNASSAFRSWTVELRDKTISLLAETGARTLSLKDANLVKGRVLVADKGTLNASFISAGVIHQVRLVADARAFLVSPNPAGTLLGRRLAASSSNYLLAGIDAILTKVKSFQLVADVGSFTLIRNPAGLTTQRRLAANARAFLVAGSPVGIIWAKRLAASPRAFNFNFIPASLLYSGGQVAGKSLYYQSILTDPRKSIVNIGMPEHQLVYYIKNFFRIL